MLFDRSFPSKSINDGECGQIDKKEKIHRACGTENRSFYVTKRNDLTQIIQISKTSVEIQMQLNVGYFSIFLLPMHEYSFAFVAMKPKKSHVPDTNQ